MCEILLRVKDKAAPDHPLRPLMNGRGDVITVQRDGWGWTKRELTNPEWRVLRLSGVQPEALADLHIQLRDRDDRLVARKTRGVDLDSIHNIEKGWALGKVSELKHVDAVRFLAARKNQSSLFIEVG